MDGTTLAQRREQLGLTRPKLAEAVGVDHATIWRIETQGQRPTPLMKRAREETLSRLERDAVVSREQVG